MLSYEFPPLGGGTGNACRHLLEQLRVDPTIRVDLVTSGLASRDETESLGDSIRIHRISVEKRSLHYWTPSELARWTWKASGLSRELVRNRDFGLCHCWSGWPAGLIGYSLRKRLPYLVALRGSDVPGYNARLKVLDPLVFRHVSRRVWRRASAITAVSEHLKSLASRTDDEVRIQVIGNGVDTSFFEPGPFSEEFTVLFAGRLVERKGVSFLLHAFRELCDSHGRCRLVIAGEGPEKNALERFCRDSGIEDRVEFRGVLSPTELRAAYRSASLFVNPAVREGMSNAVLEAMASGLPIVMTATGGSDVLRDIGTIVDAGDPEPLRAAIARYLDDRDLTLRHGAASRKLAERMTWGRTAAAYRELYERVTRSREA